MITLVRAGVRGTSDLGTFGGELEFSHGLHVIHGKNTLGKSLGATGVAWCLGLEPMYGLSPGDSGLFPEAARTQLEFPGKRIAKVQQSQAFLELRFADETVCLTRDIQGGDPRLVSATLASTGATHQLMAGSMKNEAGGLQSMLFKWAGFPNASVMTPRGTPSPIYIENIAPLFFIEQREGWSDIQALQTLRYQQMEIAEASVEYLLGLRQRLASRLAQQQSETTETKRKREFEEWAEKLVAFAAGNGWGAHIPTRLKLPEESVS